MESDKNKTNEHLPMPRAEDATKHDSKGFADDTKFTSEDKYLEIEQPGVSYTDEGHPESNSDYFNGSNGDEGDEKFHPTGENGRNADAFGQDPQILNDNIDLDEDQSQSISSEIDIDTNTTDEIL